jgi:hypothetical protein
MGSYKTSKFLFSKESSQIVYKKAGLAKVFYYFLRVYLQATKKP